MLDNVRLPSAEIDLPLREYAVLVCTLLDIPVHHNVMEPLHVLFSLFSDFKARADPAPHSRAASARRETYAPCARARPRCRRARSGARARQPGADASPLLLPLPPHGHALHRRTCTSSSSSPQGHPAAGPP